MSSRILYLFTFLVFSSCAPSRNLVYLSDLKNMEEFKEEIKNKVEPEIQPDDMLSITVSSLNPESNMLFNTGVMQAVGSGSAAMPIGRSGEGYVVDKNGNINFPVLGYVRLVGLTRTQAINKMATEIKVHVKNPIIDIKFLNFKITVIGEVARPSTFTVPTERINLLEALGLAGDLTAYGKRDNVLIIREKNGIRTAVRVNLNDKSVLSSSYFYLQQNDVVYVEPIKVKSLQGSSATFYLPLVSLAASLISVVFIIFKN